MRAQGCTVLTAASGDEAAHPHYVARARVAGANRALREESRTVWRWFPGSTRLAGSMTLVAKSRMSREMQYVALADVVRGAHLSVFVPHLFAP